MDSHTDMIAVILAQEIIKEGSQKQLVLSRYVPVTCPFFSCGREGVVGSKAYTHL